jgi:hypothetical protein
VKDATHSQTKTQKDTESKFVQKFGIRQADTDIFDKQNDATNHQQANNPRA